MVTVAYAAVLAMFLSSEQISGYNFHHMAFAASLLQGKEERIHKLSGPCGNHHFAGNKGEDVMALSVVASSGVVFDIYGVECPLKRGRRRIGGFWR
jgi:hypothetical protein